MIQKFIYNGLTIETNSTYTLNQDDFDKGVEVENNFFINPSSNGETNISVYKRRKILNIEGKIKGSNLSDLNNKIVEFKKAMFGGLKELDVYIETSPGVYSIRRTQALIVNPEIILRKQGEMTFSRFVLEFYIPSGEYRESSVNTLSGSGSTTASVSGTYEGNTITKLNSTITLSSAGITDVEIITDNGKVKLEETFNDTDVITVNGETQEVLLNGLPVDYSGQFNTWFGENITINVNGSFSYSLKYYNKFI